MATNNDTIEQTASFSKYRKCPFENKQDFENALAELISVFSECWLISNLGHPLQKLWARNDIIASIELAWLGISLKKLKDTSPDQLKQNIKLLKSNDRGTMAGAIWEIILAAAYHKPPHQESKLLGPRKPTYDIDVEMKDGSKTKISVKNFGQSTRDKQFINEFEKIENLIAKRMDYHAQVIIFRTDAYPSQQEWASLIRVLKNVIRSKKLIFQDLIDGWNISIMPLIHDHIKNISGLETARLYNRKNSYTLFIAVPFHRNENKNIESNIKCACLDLISKGSIESESLQNSLAIHLPEYVSINDYVDWCKDFFLNNPDAPITYISLLQPACAADIKNDTYFLAINHAVIEKPNNLKQIIKPIAELPVGRLSNGMRLLFNNGFKVPKNYYTMQSGHIYADYGNVTYGGKMIVKSFHGILIDAFAELNGETFSLSMTSPPNLRLTIL